MTHIPKLIRSFKFASNGILQSLSQRNIKIQLFCGITAIFAGKFFNITQNEWISLIIIVFLVISAELFNTAIEEVCNCQRDHLGASYESTRIARDVAAGAVLVISICALIVGIIIFLPKII